MQTVRNVVALILALATFATAFSPFPTSAQRGVDVSVLSFALTCDSDQCRTPVLELHERTGVDESSIEYVFAPPAGITLNDAHATGVEVDGDGVRPRPRGKFRPRLSQVQVARQGAARQRQRLHQEGYCWIGIKR